MTAAENTAETAAGTAAEKCAECGEQGGAFFISPSRTLVCARCALDGAARTSRRWARLRTAGILADIALTLILVGDIALRWHRPAPAAPACGPEAGR